MQEINKLSNCMIRKSEKCAFVIQCKFSQEKHFKISSKEAYRGVYIYKKNTTSTQFCNKQ